MTSHRVRPLLVALALAATASATSVAPAAAADPEVRVTPATGLLDGHVVQVSATGLTPGQSYLVTRCAGPDAATDCADRYVVGVESRGGLWEPTDVAYVTAGTDGSIRTDLQLEREFAVYHGELYDGVGGPGTEVDCAVDACTIAVFAREFSREVDLDEPRVVETPITMAAEGTYAWPEADLTVSTTTVQERSQVTIAATGLSRWDISDFWYKEGPFPYLAPAWIQTCAGGDAPGPDDCNLASLQDPIGDREVRLTLDGTLPATSHRIARHIVTDAGPVDCAIAGCTVAAVQRSGIRTERVPLTFAPEWAPYPSVSHFLSQAVAPARGRALTNPERADLAGRLASRSTEGVDALISTARAGAVDPASRSAAVADVTRTYQAYFGRRPDTAGLVYWAGRLRAGLSANAMATAFGRTPEFRSFTRSISDAVFLFLVYDRILGRVPDPDASAYWSAQLKAGLSRAGLVDRVRRSAEFRTREADHVAITIVTLATAGRAPTATEWSGTRRGQGDLHAVVALLLASDELR